MRAIVFLVYAMMHLLFGGAQVHAAAHVRHQPYDTSHNFNSGATPGGSIANLAAHHGTKLTHTDFTHTVLEPGDVDVVEEYANGEDVQDGFSNGLLAIDQHLWNKWYTTTLALLLASTDQSKFKITQYLLGDSSPIYIKQRVLRI